MDNSVDTQLELTGMKGYFDYLSGNVSDATNKPLKQALKYLKNAFEVGSFKHVLPTLKGHFISASIFDLGFWVPNYPNH